MTYQPNEFVMLSHRYTPRNITGYQSKPITIAKYTAGFERFDSKFELTCQCNASALALYGILNDDLELLPPLATKCICCNKKITILDLSKHGHDGEYGHGSSYPSDGDKLLYRCKNCTKSIFYLVAHYTYQFESLKEFEDIEQSKIPNYFDTFELEATCKQCGQVTCVGDYECA